MTTERMGPGRPDPNRAGKLTLWTGWDLRGGASADPSAAERYARWSPSDPGGEARYELLAVAARGFRPPRFLSTTRSFTDEGANGGLEEVTDLQGLRRVWSLLYREIAQTAPEVGRPYAIYLLGVDPPPGATPQDLDSFNDFYTNVHLPEVAERRRALRATRYELVKEVRPPYKGAPRFLAAYEVDEEGASDRRHRGPPYAAGPPVWQRHTTPWRLWYRRLPPDG